MSRHKSPAAHSTYVERRTVERERTTARTQARRAKGHARRSFGGAL